MVTGRLFHKVAAAFLKHLLLQVTPSVVGTAKNAPDSDLEMCLVLHVLSSMFRLFRCLEKCLLKACV